MLFQYSFGKIGNYFLLIITIVLLIQNGSSTETRNNQESTNTGSQISAIGAIGGSRPCKAGYYRSITGRCVQGFNWG